MSQATELTSSNFETTVSSGTTLIDFWAEWCGPCRMMSPVVDELAKQYEGKAKIAKINVDNEQDLAMKFNVSSIPTFLVIKDGEIKSRFVGVTSKAELARALDASIGG
jgi:thioredoxin 1